MFMIFTNQGKGEVMDTMKDNLELKREVKLHYNHEINALNNIKKTIEELEGQIGACANEIQQIQMSRIELEDKFENKQKHFEKLPIKDLKSSAELTSLKKEFKKEIKKLRQSKTTIDKRISYTVHKLNKSGLKLTDSEKDRKSFKNFVDRWIYTIQSTYKEVYNT